LKPSKGDHTIYCTAYVDYAYIPYTRVSDNLYLFLDQIAVEVASSCYGATGGCS